MQTIRVGRLYSYFEGSKKQARLVKTVKVSRGKQNFRGIRPSVAPPGDGMNAGAYAYAHALAWVIAIDWFTGRSTWVLKIASKPA